MVLEECNTIWRRSNARRAAVLIDCAAYFGALRRSLLAARQCVFIMGWDIHSQTRLVGPTGAASDGLPELLGEFLNALVARRPELKVHILVWQSSLLYAGEREWFQLAKFGLGVQDRLLFRLDDCLPFGSAQHQKFVVVDDSVAFSGGIDLTIRRWDTAAHAARTKHRVDPEGEPYPPFHDVQMVVDGEAARSLAELARYRWACARCGEAPAIQPTGDPWPTGLKPDFENLSIGIARTEPADDEKHEINEVLKSFVASIDNAERSIYIENQFLSSTDIARRLAQRMRDCPALEVLLIVPKTHASWLEARTMRNGRLDFMKVFTEAGVENRVRLLHPQVVDESATQPVMVHAKVMIVDDRLLRVGSANLNNRSMGTDTECDLIVEACTDAEQNSIVAIRDELIGHHCGVDAGAVQEQLSQNPSIIRLPVVLSANGHSLQPVLDGDPMEFANIVRPMADPPAPLGIERALNIMLHRSALIKFSFTVAGLCLLGLIWRSTPLSEYARFDSLLAALQSLNGEPSAPLIVVAVFVLAGLVIFPVVLLIAVTAAAFGPWLGFCTALVGVLASASLTFAIGKLVGPNSLRAALGSRLERIQKKLIGNGVIAIAIVRMVPVLPFSLVNVAAGASGIRFPDYIGGTVLGMTPGLITMSAFGAQIADVLMRPSWWNVTILLIIIIVWLLLSLSAQFVATWLSGERT